MGERLHTLAPWVLNKGSFLLGPRLRMLKIASDDIRTIPKNSIEFLKSIDFIIETNLLSPKKTKIPKIQSNKNSIEGINCWLLVIDEDFFEIAYSLMAFLNLKDKTNRWGVTRNKNIIKNRIKKDHLELFVILLSHTEPISESAIKERYKGLLSHNIKILWMGECQEGTHIGPIIQNLPELEKYKKSTQEWSSFCKITSFGFNNFWPLPIYTHIINQRDKFIEAILRAITLPSGKCILLERNCCIVSIWTTLIDDPLLEEEFLDLQFWSKGLIKSFLVRKINFFNSVFISECKSPCNKLDFLEGNSGKGLDYNSAKFGAIGEAVERFSSLQANYKVPQIKKEGSKKVYRLEDFHPFGKSWEKYLVSSQYNLPLYPVKNELDLREFSFVPECLIPFPYLPSAPFFDVTSSSTSGLAAFSNYEEAVVRGALELFERNNFYPHFLNQKKGISLKVDPKAIFESKELFSNTQHSIFYNLFSELKSLAIDKWFIVYPDTFNFPVVHCFLLDNNNHFFTRGSGSGNTWYAAIEKALLEALQIRQQFINFSNAPISTAYNKWREETIINEIFRYLNGCEEISLNYYILDDGVLNTKEIIERIKFHLKNLKKPLLIADLPSPIRHWRCVRVLIPGFTLHQYPSLSEGGKAILMPAFKHGIPS